MKVEIKELKQDKARLYSQLDKITKASSNLIDYHYHNDLGVKPKVYHVAFREVSNSIALLTAEMLKKPEIRGKIIPPPTKQQPI